MSSGLFCFMSPNQLAAPTAQTTTLPMHRTASATQVPIPVDSTVNQNRPNSHRGRDQHVSNPSAPQLLGKTPQRPYPAVSLSHLHLQHQGATMRTELDVPFSHKEEAKALGAKWDRTKKIWYVPSGVNLG